MDSNDGYLMRSAIENAVKDLLSALAQITAGLKTHISAELAEDTLRRVADIVQPRLTEGIPCAVQRLSNQRQSALRALANYRDHAEELEAEIAKLRTHRGPTPCTSCRWFIQAAEHFRPHCMARQDEGEGVGALVLDTTISVGCPLHERGATSG